MHLDEPMVRVETIRAPLREPPSKTLKNREEETVPRQGRDMSGTYAGNTAGAAYMPPFFTFANTCHWQRGDRRAPTRIACDSVQSLKTTLGGELRSDAEIRPPDPSSAPLGRLARDDSLK